MRELGMNELGLKCPLIVAPMAGGPSSVELVVAACESGALGSIGAAYSKPHEIEEFVSRVRARTSRPFAINLFIPAEILAVPAERVSVAVEQTRRYRTELQLPVPQLAPPYEDDFSSQFETVLRLRPAVLSFVFGLLKPECLTAAKKSGIFVIGTATTTDEAIELAESGVDAIVLQGVEAGGHRGIFDAQASDPNISTLDLLRETKSRVRLPLIAAGGLMNAKDIQGALQAGASAVQMGTAFLATAEAGTSSPYRQRLIASSERPTRLTRAFSGRLARGIENRFMNEMDQVPEAILPFPAQNKFTRDLRSASLQRDSSDFLSLWCGTGRGDLWTGSVAGLIESLFA